MNLWLDDNRDPTDPKIQKEFGAKGNEVWVKTAPEAIAALKTGNFTSISFDHDLGEGENVGDGYKVAQFIEESAFNKTIQFIEWRIHSANPVGKDRIHRAMTSAERFWNC